ncbi:MAG: GNAT family N-acetyltransferase [Gemmatimonadetes bacterium]|nr:MAG: GNAT family N-acetyltransferase [Gemmatimonadota bacterium]
MNIQAAKTTDLPDILTLLKTAALPVAGIENHIETTLVARDSERLLGCAAVEVYGQAGLLRSVAVEAGHRGEGWGERLTTAALELARKRGVRDIYLLTTTAHLRQAATPSDAGSSVTRITPVPSAFMT